MGARIHFGSSGPWHLVDERPKVVTLTGRSQASLRVTTGSDGRPSVMALVAGNPIGEPAGPSCSAFLAALARGAGADGPVAAKALHEAVWPGQVFERKRLRTVKARAVDFLRRRGLQDLIERPESDDGYRLVLAVEEIEFG